MNEGWFTGVDGTRLYYRSSGEGMPLILNDGIGCGGFVWEYLIPSLKDHYRIIHWNYPGHGLSEAPLDLEHLTIPDLCHNLARLCEHLSLPKAVIVGHSMGVQVVFEFARLYPEKVAGLIPVCGSYGRPLDTFHDNTLLRHVFPYMKRFVDTRPDIAQMLWTTISGSELAYQVAVHGEVNGRMLKRRDFKPYFEHIAMRDVRLFMRMLGEAQEHNSRDFLPAITIPTLIVAGDKDTFTPGWLSKEMNEAILGSEMLTVVTGSHAAPIEQPELINLRIEKFLRQHFGEAPQAKPQKPAPAPKAPAKAAAPAKPQAKKPAAKKTKAAATA